MPTFAERINSVLRGDGASPPASRVSSFPDGARAIPASTSISKQMEGLTPETSDALDALLQMVGQDLTVTSASRSPEHNAAVGGVPGSFHTKGRAFDLRVKDLDSETRASVLSRAKELPGVQAFDEGDHIHVELQEVPEKSVERPSPKTATPAFAQRINKILTPENVIDLEEVETARRKATLPDVEPHVPSFLRLFSGGMKSFPEEASQKVGEAATWAARKGAEMAGEPFPSTEEIRKTTLGKLGIDLPTQLVTGLAPLLGMVTDQFSPEQLAEWSEQPARETGEAVNTLKSLLVDPLARTGERAGTGMPQALLGPPGMAAASLTRLPETLKEFQQDPVSMIFDFLMSQPALSLGRRALERPGAATRGVIPSEAVTPYIPTPERVKALPAPRQAPRLEEPTAEIPTEAIINLPERFAREPGGVIPLPPKVQKATPELVQSRLKAKAERLNEILFPERARTELTKTEIGPSLAQEESAQFTSEAMQAARRGRVEGTAASLRARLVDRIQQKVREGSSYPEELARYESYPQIRGKLIAELKNKGIPEEVLLPEQQIFTEGSAQPKSGVYLGSGLGGAQRFFDRPSKPTVIEQDYLRRGLPTEGREAGRALRGGRNVYSKGEVGLGKTPPERMETQGRATFKQKPTDLFVETGKRFVEQGREIPKYEPSPELSMYLRSRRDLSGREASSFSEMDPLRAAEKVDGSFGGAVSEIFPEMAAQGEMRAIKNVADTIKPSANRLHRFSREIQLIGEAKTAPSGTTGRASPALIRRYNTDAAFRAKIDEGIATARKIYDYYYPKLKAVFPNLPYREDYFAQMDDLWTAIRQSGVRESMPEGISPFMVANSPAFRHTKHRMRWGSKPDAYGGVMNYALSAERMIELSKDLPKMRAALDHLPPNAKTYFTKFVNEVVAGWPNPAQAKFAEAAPEINFVANKFRQKYVEHVVRGNLSIALKQPSSVAATIKSAGTTWTTKAFAKLIAHPKELANFWRKAAPEYQIRASDIEYRPGFVGGMVRASSFPFEMADRMQVLASLEAHRLRGLSVGMSPEQAIRYANNETLKTQSSMGRIYKAPLTRHPVGHHAGILQNFTINMFNYLHDIRRIAERSGHKSVVGFLRSKESMRQLVNFGTAAMLVNLGYRQAGMEAPWDWKSFVPFYGTARYGVANPLFGGIYDMAMATAAYSSGDRSEFRYRMDRLMSKIITLAVPLQVQKAVRGKKAIEDKRVKTRGGDTKYRIKGEAEQARALTFGPEKTRAAQEYKEKMDKSNKKRVIPHEFGPMEPENIILQLLESGAKPFNANVRVDKLKTPFGTLRRSK